MSRFSLSSPSPRRYAAYALLAVLLGYLCLLAGLEADLAERVRLLRYSALLGAATFVVLTPHLLLPDPQRPLLQRLNREPRRLLTHQIYRLVPLLVVFGITGLLLAFADVRTPTADLAAKGKALLDMSLIVLGTAALSIERYGAIGPTSQAWQEGKKGGWYRAYRDETGHAFSVPEGMVPSMLATQTLFVAALAALVLSAYLHPTAWSWLPGAVLLTWAAGVLIRRAARYDHAFYATNAFYSEIFVSAGGRSRSRRAPVPYRSLYWVPVRWRPAVWASLRQIDRRLPLGRFVALAHAVLWILVYREAPATHLTTFLLLLLLVQNAAVLLHASPALSPLPFQAGRQSARDWAVTRGFINLRWAAPLVLSLGGLAVLSEAISVVDVVGWTLLDVLLAFVAAALITYAHEARYSKQFA